MPRDRITRRTRLLRVTAGLAVLFALVAGGLIWRSRAGRTVYRPGEAVEGLTDDLARSMPPDYPRVAFTDVTESAGIAFRHFQGTRSSWLPEDMGSGAAWGDFDGDGWVDLFVVNEAGPLDLPDAERRRSPARSTLYRNNRDGTFADVTDASGIDHRAMGMGAAWADYDNDGRLDLVITAFGENTLYHNNGDGTFTDRSAASGIGGIKGFWTGASWGDYDRDGFLDLYVTGYVRFVRRAGDERRMHDDAENPASLNPSSFAPERNLLYHNNRDGTFTELAARAGVSDTAGRGLSATWTDFDEDGWIDLYVANDVSDNALYRNLGNGRFADDSHSAGVADYRGAMGLAVGDWDGDGDQDMVVTHWIAQENALYDNQLSQLRAGAAPGKPVPLKFRDEADRYGLGQIALDFIGFGTSFLDYDNDGRLDLVVVNGSTFQDRNDPTRLVPMQSQLFWNRGPAQGFYDVSPVSGAYFRQARVGRGAALADYDNDGDLDLFVVDNGGPPALLRNDGGNRNTWLAVDLRGKPGNQGAGARIRVVSGGTAQVRQVGAQSSYLSQNAMTELFGLGKAASVDTLEVTWPGGRRQLRTGLPANQRILIAEDGAESAGSGREQVLAFWSVYRRATALRIAGDTSAATAYRQALALNPDHEDALYYLGQMELRLGHFAAAERAWRALARVNPQSSRPHSALGSLYLCLAEGAPFHLDSAEARFRRAHEINPEETGPSLHLAEVALMRNDPAAAGRRLAEVLGSHATNPAAQFYRGYLAWKRGDTREAEAALRRAAEGAAIRARPQNVAGEGDTRAGTPLGPAGADRCEELRDASATPGPGAPPAGMNARYRLLDSLLGVGRRKSGPRSP
ncbi:MAG TPA: FG-GAP-like repeat-containing protein [Gemmatimonadales bacterium]